MTDRAIELRAQGRDIISLSVGEPDFPTPDHVKQAAKDALDANDTRYTAVVGTAALRDAAALHFRRDLGLVVDPADVIVSAGGKQAIFLALCATLDPGDEVLVPSPWWVSYPEIVRFAGGTVVDLPTTAEGGFRLTAAQLEAAITPVTRWLLLNSPGNPTGAVLTLEEWKELFALSDQHGFVIASDECYSEIYFGNERPLGGLEAAHKLGRKYDRLISFSSLSKRSNVPGMRSGFVAGDAAILQKFLLYRTYHGSAMSPSVQAASIAAWNDETHVEGNRAKYLQKFSQVTPMLAEVLDVALPDAGFYLWARVDKLGKINDTEFARRLYAEYNVTVLPGSYVAREAHGINPGANRVRMALVAEVDECVEAAQRIVEFTRKLAA